MKPNIIFLGTGQGPTVVGKQLRSSGGVVLQSGEHQLHIDPGPSTLSMARQHIVNPRESTCILVSHNHLNHCNDINALIEAMTLGGLDKKGVFISNNMVINGTSYIAPYLTEHHKGCLEKYIVLNEGQRVGIDNIEIKATMAKHSVEAMGFKISTPEYTLSYIGDTAFFSELVDEHKDADILIINVQNPAGLNTKYNLDSDTAIELIKKIKPRLSIITHFSLNMLKADPLLEARRISRETKTPVIAAKDGLTVNPQTYAPRRPQRKLSSF